jgi:hypothetical protein
MASNATTLPLREAPLDDRTGTRRWGRVPGRAGVQASRRELTLGTLALLAIVAGGALIVVLAADRPSFLSAPSHAHFFPRWMAGPLGGLWPGLTRSNMTLKYLFTGSVVAMYAGYLLSLRYAPRLPVRWVIAAVVAAHAVLLLAPPLSLTDIFNYVNYGRMEVVHHLNPYTSIPILEPHNDPSFDLSNWHHLLSPYGPLFTLMTFVVVPLGVAGSFWALKTILMLASLGTVLLVWKCARMLDRDPVQAIVFVGLNPVVLVWGLGGDHNDFIMMFLLVLGFYLLLRARTQGLTGEASGGAQQGFESTAVGQRGLIGRTRGWLLPLVPLEIGAGASLAAATAVKASAAILLPVVLVGLLRQPRRFAQVVVGMVGAGIVLGACALIAFGPHLPDLSTQGRLVTEVSVPNLIGLALGQGGETGLLRALLSVALVASVALASVLGWRRRDIITASGWATVALLVTLSWVLPWYVLWVLPLAALSRSRALRTVALALGVYLIVAWAPLTSNLFDAIGFHPQATSLGKFHQREVKELLY